MKSGNLVFPYKGAGGNSHDFYPFPDMEFYYNSNMATRTEWKCPACGALLAMEDVNMAADMVLCRSCNKISKFSEIVQEERDEEILDSIPRRMSVTKTARGLEITYKKPKGVGLFLLMFSIFWNSVTCVALFAVMKEMSCENLFGLLFLIPFVLVGAGTFAGAFYVLFGRMTLILTPSRGELFRGVGNLGRRQHFLLEKDSRISIEESSIRRNHGTLYKIVVEQPGGKPFEFGTGIEEAEARQYIAALLRQMRE